MELRDQFIPAYRNLCLHRKQQRFRRLQEPPSDPSSVPTFFTGSAAQQNPNSNAAARNRVDPLPEHSQLLVQKWRCCTQGRQGCRKISSLRRTDSQSQSDSDSHVFVGENAHSDCSDNLAMASGYGARGQVGRCYPFWVDIQKCLSSANDPSECVLQKEVSFLQQLPDMMVSCQHDFQLPVAFWPRISRAVLLEGTHHILSSAWSCFLVQLKWA